MRSGRRLGLNKIGGLPVCGKEVVSVTQIKMYTRSIITLVAAAELCIAAHWPYDRYHAVTDKSGKPIPDRSVPEFKDQDPLNEFGHWFHNIVNQKDLGLQDLFTGGSVPDHASFDEIWKSLNIPEPSAINKTAPPAHHAPTWSHQEATELFSHLPFDLDQRCMADKNKW